MKIFCKNKGKMPKVLLVSRKILILRPVSTSLMCAKT